LLPSGQGGNITINTPSFKINSGGKVNVANFGTGDAGNLEINADSLSLDNEGEISASTIVGEGGNISLNAKNLEMLNQSNITANAGGEGNSGNITIDSETILGVENSDITANAFRGNGGNITINADYILGLEERSRLTPYPDVTASSEFGIDGTVNINTPENNLKRDVFAAFRNYATPETRELIKRRCLNPRNNKGKLLYTGRSGIPENPDNFFDDEEIVVVEKVEQEQNQPNNGKPEIWVEGDPIIDSNAVRVGKDGKMYLVAERDLEDRDLGICTRDRD
jgi:large exoprotein involved in heme utilization and adhesion